ncbi:MAG: beta-L-arabinofuranosidase domain-containing protein [Bacteroidota bacterium]
MMNNIKLLYGFHLCLLCIVSCKNPENSQGKGFLEEVNKVRNEVQNDQEVLNFFEEPNQPIDVAFKCLSQGSNLPKGWILELMKQDLNAGIVGALDELYPGFEKDDLYFKARRGKVEDVPEMGDLVLTGEEWEQSIMWWNAETHGNWWDGFIRHAYLLGDSSAIKQARAIVGNLLASQGPDGYLGIYKPTLRYQHEGSNGELWAQTTAFRSLLGFYELTGESAALNAVERAMDITMGTYGPEGKNPFELKNEFGGATHGLMMTDVCEVLFRITGDERYQAYATYLYRAFSTYNINPAFNDLRYPNLVDKEALFTGHGVHTYEQFRSLIQAYYQTGSPELKIAWENALYKLEQVILPSGAGHGNEWLGGVPANPTYTASEYCTMLELRNSYSAIFQKTGEIQFADKAEKLTYNAMMGSRNAKGTAIAYGKADNCYVMDGMHYGEDESYKDVRYKYSPTHSDPAVCCVPNYARNLPYFLDQMWLEVKDGLFVAMYGPSQLQTTVNQTSVSIEQITQYPFSDHVIFELDLDNPTSFAIYFRKPQWAKGIQVISPQTTYEESEKWVKVSKEWRNGDQIQLNFDHQIQQHLLPNGEVYMQRGPLVFAYPIAHKKEVIKTYRGTDFTDYHCHPQTDAYETIHLPPARDWVYEVVEPFSREIWTGKQPRLKAGDLSLVPLGNTVLRKVSFPLKDS